MKVNVPINQTDVVILLVLAVMFVMGIRVVIGFFKPARKPVDTRRDAESMKKSGTKVTVDIDGMMCGMCESHIKDAIRAHFPEAEKLTVSHSKGLAEFYLNRPESLGAVSDRLHEGIDPLGYRIISVKVV